MNRPHLPALPILACPHDGRELQQDGNYLRCRDGHSFPVVEGIPVLLRDDVVQTIDIASQSLRLGSLHAEGRNDDPWFVDTLGLSDTEKKHIRTQLRQANYTIDPVISYLIGATNGILYKHSIGSLEAYPIPELPMPSSSGERLLDLGCNWGRWSIAAAQKGYEPVGLDPSLGAVLAAKRLSEKLGQPFIGIVADARFLPFQDDVFDATFSFSVLQHFSKSDARTSLGELRRVLRTDGKLLVQMASAWGIRSLQHQMRRGFREPKSFDVRYWTPKELKATFRELFGNAEMTAQGYFGLGLLANDISIMPMPKQAIIYCSEFIRIASLRAGFLRYVADSLYFRVGF